MAECLNGHNANSDGQCSNSSCVYRASNRNAPVALPEDKTDVPDDSTSANWWD